MSVPCGAVVVLGRYEGHPQITRWCERRSGPCPWGPRVDLADQSETCLARAEGVPTPDASRAAGSPSAGTERRAET